MPSLDRHEEKGKKLYEWSGPLENLKSFVKDQGPSDMVKDIEGKVDNLLEKYLKISLTQPI